MADWLVAVAEFQKEARAGAHLGAAGFNCYQPRCRERKVIHGRRVWIERFLFTRYLLIEMLPDWMTQYLKIVASPFVATMLLIDEKPVLAREHEVQRLKNSEVRGYIPVPKHQPFLTGQRVLVKRGPFFNHLAVFEGQHDSFDVVGLDFLGRYQSVHLPIGSVIAA